MTEKRQDQIFKLLLPLHVLLILFWFIFKNNNIYEYRLVGILAELLWLPMMLLLPALPFADLFFWFQDKFRIRSKFLGLFIFSFLPILIIILSSQT